MQRLNGHVPAAARQLQPIGRLPATQHLQLAMALPGRNPAGLKALLHDLYDPTSPRYRHYLTPAQFAEQYGPTQQDYDAVAGFATAHGWTVTKRYGNRLVVDVDAQVADIEKALHVTMRVYRHPTEGRTFYAPDTEPSLDLATPLAHIGGLQNYALPQPRVHEKTAASVKGNAGSGPTGAYMGNDFRTVYAPGVALTGAGQTIGLLQFGGYSAADITYYESLAGLPNVPLTNVLVDGFNGRASGGNTQIEVSLDIEMAISMAPGASGVIVYEAGSNGSWLDLLNRMASDDLAKQLSCSWYLPNGTENTGADAIFQEMAAQGQSFGSASGDDDAYTGLIPFPGDTPYITQVGGTTLTVNGTGGAWQSETVWNWGNGTGSGGGVSTQYAIPAWQQGISMAANGGSTTMRNVPDVALAADNIYVRAAGADHYVGGTSCAAPLWAGFLALVNQQAVSYGSNTVGFVNPAVYAIAQSSGYGAAFHDITTGNNTSSTSPNEFYAAPGYDLCTGVGTPTGAGLIAALAVPPDSLVVSSAGVSFGGPAGGPFTGGGGGFTLINTGTGAVTWTASGSQSWLTLSATTGTLAVSGSAGITASVNGNANALGSGTYSGMVTFTDVQSGYVATKPVSLTVISAPVISSSTSATAVNGGSFSYQITATNSPTSYNATGLPAGLLVNNMTGIISGTTTATGTWGVTLSAVNAGGTGSATLGLTVLPPVPVITSTLAATEVSGSGLSYRITASNAPTSYGASGLLSGLSVNTSTGVISGTATGSGTHNITIRAYNAGGNGSATLKLTLVPPAPVITGSLSATGTAGSAFSYQINATNSPTVYGATGLPSGLNLATGTGLISGTATGSGVTIASISASNLQGTGSAALMLTMLSPPPVITSGLSATGTTGLAFRYQISASNNPTSFGASGLPAGLSIKTSTGVISGTLATTGTSAVTVSAANGQGTGYALLTLTGVMSYQGWQSGVFPAADFADPSATGAEAEPAGDGIPNLMKYALNLNPFVDGQGGLPVETITTSGTNHYLTLTYTKVLSATDITYTVQVSNDLLNWYSGAGYTAAPVATPNGDGVTESVSVEAAAPVESGTAEQFMRLQVTQP